MILLQRDMDRPVAVESSKAQVLACLRAGNALADFDDLGDLRPLLDQVEDGTRQVLGPIYAGLSRIILFHRAGEAKVVREVARRMMPGGVFYAYAQPGCWMRLGQQVGVLKQWARKAEPGFIDAAFADLKMAGKL